MATDSTARDASESADTAGLPLDTVYEVLAHQRRKYVLACLAEHGPSLALADVAEEVAGREGEVAITEIPKDTVLAVYMSLYHSHIPKLVAAGIVDYEQDRDLVTVSDVDRMKRVRSFTREGRADR